MGRILPIIIALTGLGGGLGAGYLLRPAPQEPAVAESCAEPGVTDGEVASAAAAELPDSPREYVKLNNQFVIPVVEGERVSSLVVLSLSLEVRSGGQEAIYEREPRIRDAFLQVLFDHANSGGFDGAFTNGRNMLVLRDALRESAIKTFGTVVTDVLIIDIVRQDA